MTLDSDNGHFCYENVTVWLCVSVCMYVYVHMWVNSSCRVGGLWTLGLGLVLVYAKVYNFELTYICVCVQQRDSTCCTSK